MKKHYYFLITALLTCCILTGCSNESEEIRKLEKQLQQQEQQIQQMSEEISALKNQTIPPTDANIESPNEGESLAETVTETVAETEQPPISSTMATIPSAEENIKISVLQDGISYKLNPDKDLHTSISSKAVTIGTTSCYVEISIEGVSVDSISMKQEGLQEIGVRFDSDHNFYTFGYTILGGSDVYTIIVTTVNGNQYFATFIY